MTELPSEFRMAKENSQADCRVAILAVRANEIGVVFEKLHRPLAFAEGAGFSEGELEAAIDKQLCDLRMSVIERQQHRRRVS